MRRGDPVIPPAWIGPDDPRYTDSLRVWNCRVQARPRAVVRPVDVADVRAAVQRAGDEGLRLAIRGGGHHVSGAAVRTDGLVVDLRSMRACAWVQDDVLRVGAGTTWHDVASAAAERGAAVPAGNSPSTGTVGVALGGGIGPFTRAWGLTCDRVVGLGLVDANGRHRHVDADHDPDLLWLARGAGRGIGVVTDVDLRVEPSPSRVAVVQVHHAGEAAHDVLRRWCEATARADRTVSPQLTVRRLPDIAALDERLRGRLVVSVGAVHAGSPDDAAPRLDPFRRLADPLIDHSGTYPVAEEPLPWRPGLRVHSASRFLPTWEDAPLRAALNGVLDGPAGASLTLRTLGGATRDTGRDTAAFAHRDAAVLCTLQIEWTDPADDTEAVAWCRRADEALAGPVPHGVYGNFVADPAELPSWRELAYGDTAAVDRVLAAHDPDGVFAHLAALP